MTSLVTKWAIKKTGLADHLVVGNAEDPYYEAEDPTKKRSWYHRKHMKPLPSYFPEKDIAVLKSVRARAYRLDLQVKLCGVRLGWAGLIGLIPFIGDFIACYLAVMVIRKASEVEGGLPEALRARMMGNVLFDFGMGLIPFVGDLVSIAYKCNSRNYVLLEKHLMSKHAKRTPTDTATRAIVINPNLVQGLENSSKPSEPHRSTGPPPQLV